MQENKSGRPPVIRAQLELDAARAAINQAIDRLKEAMGLGLRGAGGEHAPRALAALETALGEIDRAIGSHSRPN